MVNDFKTIRCLRKLGNVEVIYLQKLKYVPLLSALTVFIFQLIRSFSRSYRVYFSRSLIASAILTILRPVLRSKVIHQALSVPFPSDEVSYIPRDSRAKAGLNRFEIWTRYALIRFMERTVLPNVDAITVAAPEYVEQLAAFGVPKDRVKVIPFYVEDEFHRQPLKSHREGAFTFCYVGAFHLYHEFSSLISAFELFSLTNDDAELLFVGDGPKRSEIESEVARRNLTHKIKFLGGVPHSLLPSFLSRVDAFVLLTLAAGLPIGLLEAAAVGKAIIAVEKKPSDALGHYFGHGKGAYLVSSFSPDEIAGAMRSLYEDSDLRDSLAKRAKEIASQHFTESITFQSLKNLLFQL